MGSELGTKLGSRRNVSQVAHYVRRTFGDCGNCHCGVLDEWLIMTSGKVIRNDTVLNVQALPINPVFETGHFSTVALTLFSTRFALMYHRSE